jgi:hypothetical protein
LGYLGISTVSQKAGELEEMGRSRDLQQSAEAFAVFDTEIIAILNSMRSVNGVNLEKHLETEAGATTE